LKQWYDDFQNWPCAVLFRLCNILICSDEMSSSSKSMK
jgi:hypothetical protein